MVKNEATKLARGPFDAKCSLVFKNGPKTYQNWKGYGVMGISSYGPPGGPLVPKGLNEIKFNKKICQYLRNP